MPRFGATLIKKCMHIKPIYKAHANSMTSLTVPAKAAVMSSKEHNDLDSKSMSNSKSTSKITPNQFQSITTSKSCDLVFEI